MLAVVVPAAATACGSAHRAAPDAGLAADGPAAACPTALLTGGTDVAAQGWSVVMQPPATLTSGPDYVQLQTSTSAGAKTGGQLLLSHPGAVEPGKLFKIQVVMQVEAVNPHNQFDSAAAILGSFAPPFGAGNDRDEMIYLDSNKIGWADDNPSTPPFAFAVTDRAYHTYELSVDAAGAATVRVDGTQALTRTGFTTSGAIAVGDQTNDANVDCTLRIRSVTRLCP